MSALLEKSVQHVHRYSGFIQTIEYGFMMCSEYLGRFHAFPEARKVDEGFFYVDEDDL